MRELNIFQLNVPAFLSREGLKEPFGLKKEGVSYTWSAFILTPLSEHKVSPPHLVNETTYCGIGCNHMIPSSVRRNITKYRGWRSRARLSKLRSQLCYLVSSCPWASYITHLELQFL